MGKHLIAAAAAAWLAAAPAVRAADLCSFVRAAIADVPNSFASLVVNGQDLKRDLGPDGASSCGVLVSNKRVGCFWVYPGVSAEEAKSKLDTLSTSMGQCLGPGYQRRSSDSGGLVFSDGEDRVSTNIFQDQAGAWETYVMIMGHGLTAK